MKAIFCPTYQRLISHLRQRRLDLGLSQEEVANRLGVYRSAIGKIEQRERLLDVVELYHLCAIYEIQWADLEPLLKERP